ncbi:unnamed protein product [Mucor fragilis]
MAYGLEDVKDILKGQTCGAFMNNLLTDTNIKGIIDELICKVQEIFSKYSKSQNSPDGIQHVILHHRWGSNYFYEELFRVALLDANWIDPQNDFIHVSDGECICFGAMQKPFKMVQLANALLPPTIWKDGNCKQLEWKDNNTCEEDLLPPNSFYVQAYINDEHIRFVLNKVIAVSSVNGALQKSTFTVQEMSVELESILDSVCDIMWNHLMLPECQRDPDLFDHCDTHLAGEYSAANYYLFKCSIQEMTEKLLQGDFVTSNQDIDSSHAIPISKECSCSLQISFRTLVDIGLQPAITHIATIIASSLASNIFFGLYTVSALIIMDDSKYSVLQNCRNIFEKTMQRCLEVHHGRTIVFYNREMVIAACASLGSWCTGLQQVFGKGSYSQVSSTDYVLQFSGTQINGTEEGFEIYKYHSNSFKKGDFIERPKEFVIPKKGQAVDPNGSTHAFYCRNSVFKHITLGLYMITRHENKEQYHGLWFRGFSLMAENLPFTIRVTPQHHSSTIEFEASYANDFGSGIYPGFESFSIQERLALK